MQPKSVAITKKILVISGSVGLGHKVVAENIAAVLRTYPGIRIDMLDALELYDNVFTRQSARLYTWILRHWPGLWRFFYTNPWFLRVTLPLRVPVATWQLRKYRDFVVKLKPDLILTTHPTATALAVSLKQQKEYLGAIVTTFSDFHFQPYWVYAGVDRYLVMTAEQQQAVMKSGFAEKRVIITGLPVDPLFSENYDEGEICREFDLSHRTPIILVMGGSRGWGVTLANIQGLLESAFEIQIAVVTGYNKKLLQELRDLAANHPRVLKVFGHLESLAIAKLFSVAKILVTKPGGLTIAQALLKNLPMILVNPLPAMEELNLDYLRKRGVGLFAKDSQELRLWVERLLQDKKFYQEVRDRTRQLSQPEAAALAAEAVIDML